jgi:hypothetical protein
MTADEGPRIAGAPDAEWRWRKRHPKLKGEDRFDHRLRRPRGSPPTRSSTLSTTCQFTVEFYRLVMVMSAKGYRPRRVAKKEAYELGSGFHRTRMNAEGELKNKRIRVICVP